MSYSQDARQRRVGTGFSSSGRRTVMGYWVPLALTVGIATIGVAAWIWSERNEEDDDNEGDYPRGDDRFPAGPPPGGVSFPPGGFEGEHTRSAATDIHGDDASMMARMQGALRRTPSPQQIFDGASKRVAAGVAAAGAFMGSALTSIREENKGDFEDHSRWSEEAESRALQRDQPDTTSAATSVPPARGAPGGLASVDKKRKTVVIVVSSETLQFNPDDLTSEHVSILSHLPEHINPDTARVFIMIYAPGLKHAPSQGSSSHPLSIASSYSNINPEEAVSSGESPSGELSTLEPRQAEEQEGATPLFNTLYNQAQAIVDKENTIMPFSTSTGYVHLVRHISPDTVYVQESLAGEDGTAVHHMSGWVRQVVVVLGDDGGRGGLIDSDDESALAGKDEKWWRKEGVTGIGKRIDVVDVLRVGDDWRRRINGHD